MDFTCQWCDAPPGKPCDYYVCQTAREKRQLAAFRWPDTLSLNIAWAASLCASEFGTLARCINIVEKRLQHYELYRTGDMMKTHPATFAALEEIHVMLSAELSRRNAPGWRV